MSESVRAWAERVLLGRALSDKLAPFEGTEDHVARAPGALPDRPGRPPELAFDRASPRPVVRALRDERDRGSLLHAFANHELLAAELFALALLRFPDAPTRLRRTWVATLVEEQAHLGAYLDRLASTGVALGEVGVSTHFWDVLAPVDDVGSFVVGMGLVLEQANLDFAGTWRERFRQAGDPATAAVLDGVVEDEIRHVRLGVRWMRALVRRPSESDWDAFVRAAPPGLGPARARGPVVDREARRRAGLDASFVRELETFGGSRGRVPRCFVMNAGVEDLLGGHAAVVGVDTDLAALPLWAAEREDVVLAPRPATAWLATLADRGIGVPSFAQTRPERVSEVVPWSWSPGVPAAQTTGRDADRVRVFAKTWAAETARELARGSTFPGDPADVGVVCSGVEAVRAAIADGRPYLVKAAYSASGRHRVRVEGTLDDRAASFVRRAGEVVVEPWLEVVAELSVHADVEPDRVRVLGITRFWARHGVFRGVVLGPPDLGLAVEVARFLDGGGTEERAWSELRRVVIAVAERARELGHRGPLSVDALVARGGDGALRLKPLSEVNPRVTMGRLSLAVRRRLAPSARGLWLFVPTATLARGGTDAVGLVAELDRRLPAELRDGRLARGVVATTDPAAARRVATLAVVAPTFADVSRVLAEVADDRPALRGVLEVGPASAPRSPFGGRGGADAGPALGAEPAGADRPEPASVSSSPGGPGVRGGA